MCTDIYDLRPGTGPLLMSIPHLGTVLPDQIAPRMTAAGHLVADTDWHLDRLYDFAAELGATIIGARYSRYVIDLNRAPDNKPLYPGARNTELVPTTTFDEEPIYLAGEGPGEAEIDERRTTYWQPYHQAIESQLAALRARHGTVVLFDCHSIRSRVPRFFDGTLPDFNLGTAEGNSCAPKLRDRLAEVLRTAGGNYRLAVDGRFKGGYITRQYGRPAAGIHAFQMELSQVTYMDETPPFAYRDDRAAAVKPALRAMLAAAVEWAAAR
jgi:N-formylglutamate deformylase